MSVAPFEKSVVSPVLVGRDKELSALTQFVEQAARGNGYVALVAGEAGIGKSRLVSEMIARAEKRGLQILKGNCFETDRALPYAPFTDLLRDAQRPPADVPRELAPILSDLGLLSPTATLDPKQEKRRVFNALAEFFVAQTQGDHTPALQRPGGQRGASESSPLLIVIEDLHWSDDTSIEFLLHLARQIHSQPLLLLLTYRSDEINPVLSHFLAELDRARLASELRLSPLAPPETDAMLRAIFEIHRPVRSEFLNILHQLTDGNPFFIEEILKALIANGEIFYAEGAWDRKPITELHIPRSVNDAVRQRSTRLSEQARQVLQYAAVTGRRFNFGLLMELLHLDEHALMRAIKELVAEQLVVEESADQFSFRHALTREAVYTLLLMRERKKYHRTIAETMERLYADSLDAHSTDLAYQFYQAEEWDEALKYSERAGRKAQALYAPREAAEQFTHAIESAKRLGAPPSAALWRARGGTNETLGDFENARADFIAALASADAAKDRVEEWFALMELGKLWASRDYAKAGEYYQSALERAREMDDAPKIAHSLNRIGNWHSNLDRPREAIPAHQEALTIFQTLENSEGIAETSDLLGMTNWIGGDLIQSAVHYHQAIHLFRDLNNRHDLVSSLATLALRSATYKTATLCLPLEKFSQANASREEALKIAREIESRSGEAYALWCLGGGLGTQGEYARAVAMAQASLAIAEEIQHQQWLTAANGILGMLYLDLLALPQATMHLERALALAHAIGSLHWIRVTSSWLVMALTSQKEFARAESVLGAAIPSDAPMDSVGKRQCWLARAELSLARGDAKRAVAIAEALIASAYSESHAPLSANERIIPHLWKLRGDALAAQSSPEAASVLLEAIQAASDQGALPLLWRIHVSFGALNPKANAEHFDTAREIIAELAQKITDATLRDNFSERAFTMMPSAPALSARQIAKKEFGGLTAREREVAALIAQGKTNREIAEAMVVSERTIETHVGNVLTKLGFGSRAQIAAWATEKKIERG